LIDLENMNCSRIDARVIPPLAMTFFSLFQPLIDSLLFKLKQGNSIGKVLIPEAYMQNAQNIEI